MILLKFIINFWFCQSECKSRFYVFKFFFVNLSLLSDFWLNNDLKVHMKLNGEVGETGIRVLNDAPNNSLLQTASVDSFIMSVNK